MELLYFILTVVFAARTERGPEVRSGWDVREDRPI